MQNMQRNYFLVNFNLLYVDNSLKTPTIKKYFVLYREDLRGYDGFISRDIL